MTAPIIALFDPDLKTVLETDCSGWAMGACLSQWDKEGRLQPVGYFSKKLSPAECNYDIHDKELLAVVRAVEFWRPELMSLIQPVKIITDHKNLKYFMTKRTLSERQNRWKSLLDSLPTFYLRYRPGREGTRPNALSRLEQDSPIDPNDARLKFRDMQLINDIWISTGNKLILDQVSTITSEKSPFHEEDLARLWNNEVQADGEFRDIKEALAKEKRCFPPSVTAKISISKCEIDILDRFDGEIDY